MPDRVHLFLVLSKTIAVAELVVHVKKDSSRWMERRTGGFAWQDAYSALTVGVSQRAVPRRHIDGQKEHHRTVSFQDELRKFYQSYGTEWDQRYVWG